MSRRAVRLFSFGGVLLGASLGLFGCVRIPGQSGSLTIATSWSEAERSQLDEAFERWLVNKLDPEPLGTGIRIDWLTIERGTDLSRVVRPRRGRWDPRPPSPDIVLGGPLSSYRRLAKLGKLSPIDGPEQPLFWSQVHRSPMGWAVTPKAAGSPTKTGAIEPAATQEPASSRPARPTFDDPRHDPVALAWAKGELNSGSWAEGYARLVRDAGHSRGIGRQAGSALAAVERGEAEATPAVAIDVAGRPRSVRFLAAPGAPDWIEGAGIVASPRSRRLSQMFFQFLNETGQAEPPRPDATDDFEVDSLLADLLGATMVDAQEELWTAWATLNRAGQPARAAMWLTQAPPWPPASIEKLEGDNSEVLVQTLIEQLAPDADLRAWLSRSWLGPKRLVDGALLEEIAHAADGRLAREPRFRAWLRAEWTAWARQRYRRVTRTVTGLKP